MALRDVDFDFNQLRFKSDDSATHHLSQHNRLLLDVVSNHGLHRHDLARSTIIISRMATRLKGYRFLIKLFVFINPFCKQEHIVKDGKQLCLQLQATIIPPPSFTAQQAAKRPPLGGLAVFDTLVQSPAKMS
ncbi:MAG: hypothetical protein AMJ56_05035 [Anaerolineae bacterium SG8_19]|nr:MAG: hypothetical protein AMJ56_05035 [Anaerolineae bacterium SG8_19]